MDGTDTNKLPLVPWGDEQGQHRFPMLALFFA